MPDNVVDSITLEIDATTDKAEKGIDKTIESLNNMKKALNGINTKKFRQEMESFAEFQQKLKTSFQNITVSGNAADLKKQIAQAEAQLDRLLGKESKIAAVSGIDENSKQYRNLQYDISKVCATLDQLYAAMDRINAQKPLNFWEKAGWSENLQKYGTTDENSIASSGKTQQPESLASYSVGNIKESFAEVTQGEKEAAQGVQSLGAKLQGLKGIAEQVKTAFSGFREKLSAGVGAEKFNADMQSIIDGMNQAKYTMKQMESGAKAFDSVSYQRAARELAAASAQMQNYKNSLTGATEHTNRLKIELSGIGAAIKGAFAKLGSFGSGIVSACKTALSSLKGLKSYLPKLGTAFSGLGKKLKSFGRLGVFMALRKMITAVFNSVKEGFDLLARYSAAKGTEFNNNVSMMQSSLKTLGNSLIAAFEPIINVVAPILTAFIQKLIAATNAIGQFFAALTGKSTYTKAKKVVTDYAAGLDKATDSAKKLATATAGIDELNILSQDNSQGGADGEGTSPEDAFETNPIESKFADLAQMIKDAWAAADFSGIGALLAEKINSALESMPWDKIKQTAWRIAHSLATFVNGAAGGLSWELLGATIGEGINTALTFANTLIATIDWGQIGRALATGLNSAVNTVNWPAVGKLICTGFNSVIDLLYDFVKKFNFAKFGENIGTALTTAIKGIKWEKGGAAIGKAVTGLFNAFNGFIEKTDFASLGKGIVAAIGGFFNNLSWGSIGSALSGSIKALLNFLYGVVSGISWAKVPRYIVNAIKDFFVSFDWSGVSKSLGQLLGSAVKGAVDFVGSIWDMLKTAWGDLSEYFEKYIEDAGGDIVAGLWNGITNALKNCGTWIKDNLFTPFIDGFKTAFGIASPSKEMQEMGGYIVDGLISGITEKYSVCMDTVKEWCSNVKEWFYGGGKLKDKFTQYGEKITSAFSDKVKENYGVAQGSISAWAADIREWFSGNSHGAVNRTTFSGYANSIISGFREKVGNTYSTVRGNIAAWAADVLDYFAGSSHGNVNREKFSSYATNIINGFKNRVADYYTSAQGAMTTFSNAVKNWFEKPDGKTSIVSKFFDIGSNVIQGFIDGVNSLWDAAMRRIKEFGQSIISSGKEGTDEHSPSRAFKQIGAYVVKGFNLGVEEEGKTTSSIIRSWLDFSNIDVNLGTRLRINDSALKDYQNNYGSDFTNDVIVRRVMQNNVNSHVSATVSPDNLTAAFGEVAKNIIIPAIERVEVQTKRQADKKEQTVVEIGGKVITDCVRNQTSRNGFSFQPT